MTPPPDWHHDALCAQVDGDLWFPDDGTHGNPAKTICHQCPVLAQCLDYALADPTLQGIWGATTVKQRRRIRRERAA